MKKVFFGLVFLVVSLTACPSAGSSNFAGALELPSGQAFNQAIGFAVGACVVVSGACDPNHPNSKAVVINAKVGDTKVSFAIADVKPGNYFIVLFDANQVAIGGLIDAAEKFISVAPPKLDLKIIIAPSQLGGAIFK